MTNIVGFLKPVGDLGQLVTEIHLTQKFSKLLTFAKTSTLKLIQQIVKDRINLTNVLLIKTTLSGRSTRYR